MSNTAGATSRASVNAEAEACKSADARVVQRWARLAGALYLVIIVIGLFGEAFIRNSLVVSGDAAATVQRILASEFLWRVGVAGQMLLLVCAVGLSATWYLLLRPVSKNLTLLAMFFAVISLAVESVSALQLQAVLTPLSGAPYLSLLEPQQRAAMAQMAVVSHAQAFGMALIFFGVECLIIGHLVRRSGYFPKAIGVLMQLAGLCYLVNSFSMVLSPSLHALLFPAILLPALVGEASFCLWLLVKGVDVRAWRASSQRA